MSFLRIALFLLLSLALPVNGMAHLLMSAKPCAMPGPHLPASEMHHQGDGHAMAGIDHGQHATHHVDGGEPGHEGHASKPCKSGPDCKTGSLLQVVSSKTPDIPFPRPAPSSLSFALLPGTSEPLWHPPRG